MFRYILTVIWYMIPGMVGNMAPVISKKILGNFFDYPLDFNKKLNGKPILGKNKTFRGFIAGIIFAIATIHVQAYFFQYEAIKRISIIDYYNSNLLVLGFLIGFGTLFMDSFKSFFKRRRKITPADPWIPFDQMDMLLGYLIFVIPFFPIDLIYIPGIIIYSPLWVVFSNQFGYAVKVKNTKW